MILEIAPSRSAAFRFGVWAFGNLEPKKTPRIRRTGGEQSNSLRDMFVPFAADNSSPPWFIPESHSMIQNKDQDSLEKKYASTFYESHDMASVPAAVALAEFCQTLLETLP